MLAYAIRTIVSPEFAFCFTGDLLKLLVQVEEVRLKAVNEAQKALRLSARYEKEHLAGKNQSVRWLTKVEKAKLSYHTEPKKVENMRYRYRSLISLLCELVCSLLHETCSRTF